MKTDQWHGCYDLGWKGIITDESFAHPAKFSHALIRRIYQHAAEEGWLKPGDTVVDPFGGVSLGALYAMKAGLDWVGLELEPRFVKMGNDNIVLWNDRFGSRLPNWGRAVLLQGDSRELVSQLAGVGMVVSSPLYSTGDTVSAQSITKRTDKSAEWLKKNCGSAMNQGYGESDGQLGVMPSGNLATVISSPPFAGNSGGRGEASRQGIDAGLFDRHSGGMIGGMGDEDGNLGNLRHGDVGAVIGSPPYEGSVNQHEVAGDYDKRIERMAKAGIDVTHKSNVGGGNSGYNHNQVYGQSDGQVGATTGDTFWSAARLIVEQCYQILSPGGHAIWVVKDFVRGGQRVEFSDQWRQLCEAVGLETLHCHHAMLVKEQGQQTMIGGGEVDLKVERKSFFRRLHEKNGLPRIDWETVLCMFKP